MKLSLCTIVMDVTALNEGLFWFFTINGNKEITEISQNSPAITRMQVILSHIDTVVIHIAIVIFYYY